MQYFVNTKLRRKCALMLPKISRFLNENLSKFCPERDGVALLCQIVNIIEHWSLVHRSERMRKGFLNQSPKLLKSCKRI